MKFNVKSTWENLENHSDVNTTIHSIIRSITATIPYLTMAWTEQFPWTLGCLQQKKRWTTSKQKKKEQPSNGKLFQGDATAVEWANFWLTFCDENWDSEQFRTLRVQLMLLMVPCTSWGQRESCWHLKKQCFIITFAERKMSVTILGNVVPVGCF